MFVGLSSTHVQLLINFDETTPFHMACRWTINSVAHSLQSSQILFLVSLLPWPLEFSPIFPSLSPSFHNLLQVKSLSLPLISCSWLGWVVLTFISSYAEGTTSKSAKLRDDWRQKSRPIAPGGTYPAKDHCRFFVHTLSFDTNCYCSMLNYLQQVTYYFNLACGKFPINCLMLVSYCLRSSSRCGLCDTYYIAHVKNACAFLGDGMSRIEVSFVFVFLIIWDFNTWHAVELLLASISLVVYS